MSAAKLTNSKKGERYGGGCLINHYGEDYFMEEKLANPAPLGLMGFGMTTVLLNIHNAGFFPVGTMILAMGLCYGGLAQIIAGILEYKKGNTFGVTAFTSYGLFWWTLVFILVLKACPTTQKPLWAGICSCGVSLPFSCGLVPLERTGAYSLSS